jgi:4-hydroxy-tetrahydrodipicolinate synthase
MTDSLPWRGIYPAALTMFDRQGGLDEEASAAHLDRLITAGAHGVVVGGTSGEFIGLTERERVRLVEVAVGAAADRVPVIAGTGWFSTRETISLTRAAADAGADGAIVILPYYQKPTVGRASPIPVMVYNNPANSSAPPLEAAQLRELYSDGYAHAVKSTFPTVHQVHEVRAATDDGFRVFYGSFMAPLEGMAGGAHGWISGILNVVTADAVTLWNAMQASDLAAARAAWARILPIKELYTKQPLGPASDLAIYRAMLRLRGQVAGYCRAPLLDLAPEQVERLRPLLEPIDAVAVA